MLKYVKQLTEEQLKELMQIYAENHQELTYEFYGNSLHVRLRDREGLEDNYYLTDYDVSIIDWYSSDERTYLEKYRKKCWISLEINMH